MTVTERTNEFIQLPAFLIINRTGGRHITIDNVVIVGAVSLNTPLDILVFFRFQSTMHMEINTLHKNSL